MNPERWRQVEQIYHSTKDRKPGERSSFLVKACEGDDELRREVELLLVQDAQAEPTILTASTQTQFGLGSELGSYRMEAVLGAGGMGEDLAVASHRSPVTGRRMNADVRLTPEDSRLLTDDRGLAPTSPCL